jgi:hypothetical protein
MIIMDKAWTLGDLARGHGIQTTSGEAREDRFGLRRGWNALDLAALHLVYRNFICRMTIINETSVL